MDSSENGITRPNRLWLGGEVVKQDESLEIGCWRLEVREKWKKKVND